MAAGVLTRHERRLTTGIGIALLGVLAGAVLAACVPDHRGAEHRCPAGAPESACFYPAHLALHYGLFVGLGALVGILVAAYCLRAVSGRETEQR